MPARIVLLTGEVEAPHLTAMLTRHNPTLAVDAVNDAAGLDAAIADGTAGCRLLAVMTDVIVPADVLSALPGPAYNFHPGPPAYPGSCAASFAVYDGATEFGVTLHEMAARVDSGPICEVRRFPIAADAKFAAVEIAAFQAVLEMFRDHAPHLASDDAPLPRSGDHWTGPVRTRAEAAAYREVVADLAEEEIVRRYRAFG